MSYRQREGRFRTSSPDYPENPEKPTGGYLSNDWSMQLNRPHDPFATTGRYPGIDWSMQEMAGTRKSGVCKELIY
ncbi:hypothetical protein [Phocaeicola coprophilus]|uniref:hypothetical protein n=1 Tax=Phocaeicola coprophilus TaxID=387090 RepID=UPI00266D27D6|nr:hypothetical protein [Phocaeicola coprophilus]